MSRGLVVIGLCVLVVGAHGQEGPSSELLGWLQTPEGRAAQGAVRRFPTEVLREFDHTRLGDRAFVRALAKRAWRSLDDLRDVRSGLPLDRVDLWPEARLERRTSTNNTGLYLAAIVAAGELGFLDVAEAAARLSEALDAVEKLQAWRGHPYEWFSTETLEPEGPCRASTVASGWLCAGLMVAADALTGEGRARCERLISRMDFGALYDAEAGLFRGHYDAQTEQYADYHNGCLYTETRIGSYIAIGLGQVPPEHYFHMWRIAPDQRDPQRGREVSYSGVPVWEESFEYLGVRLGARSWGGAMFESLAPSLLVDEAALAPRSLARQGGAAVDAQIAFSKQAGYPVWGFSPCAVPGKGPGAYDVFGVPGIATVAGYGTDVATPHAAALALCRRPEEATACLRRFLDSYPSMSGPYGPYDAVNPQTGQVCGAYLALDEAMLFLSAANYLTDGSTQKALLRYPGVVEKLAPVLGMEAFEFDE